MQRKKILVIGDVMLDRRIEGKMTRISPESPSPVIELKEITDRPGGAANVAANVAGLGGTVALFGFCGNDQVQSQLEASLQTLALPGLSFKFVQLPDFKSTVKTRITCGGQQVLRVDEGSRPPEEFKVRDAVAAHLYPLFYQNCELALVVVADYDKGSLPSCVIRMIKDYAAAAQVPIFVDARPSKLWMWGGSLLAKINQAEAVQVACEEGAIHPGLLLTGVNQAEAAATYIQDRHKFGSVIVTRGQDGATAAAPGGVYDAQTVAQPVYDVTGAGDTFMASLAVSYVDGVPALAAIDRANVAAGLAVKQHGTVVVHKAEVLVAERAVALLRPANCGWLGKRYSDAAFIVDYVKAWRELNEGRPIVLTNGCFDMLHLGHMHLLWKAKKPGGLLIAAFNNDASVTALKGPGRPLVHESYRGQQLASLAMVDLVVMFDGQVEPLVQQLRPDILVKGAEYKDTHVPGSVMLETYGGKVEFVEMLPGYSTTKNAGA